MAKLAPSAGRGPGEAPVVLLLGAGFLGAATGAALLARGCALRVMTRSELDPTKRSMLAEAEVLIGDAREMGSLASALADVDHVVYALGSSSPVESDLDPANDVALVVPPLVRLLELLSLRPNVGLTFLSSGGTVYGEQPPGPTKETAATRPISSYGIIKLTCEHFISMYADDHGIPARVLRISNAYGPGQRPVRGQGLIARLLQSAVTGERLPLYGTPAAVRDYVYIDDIANAIADVVCTDDAPRVMNVGHGVGHTIADAIEIVEGVTGRRLSVDRHPARRCDLSANVLDAALLRSVVDFDPIDLRTGVERTWKWVLDTEMSAATPPRFPANAPP